MTCCVSTYNNYSQSYPKLRLFDFQCFSYFLVSALIWNSRALLHENTILIAYGMLYVCLQCPILNQAIDTIQMQCWNTNYCQHNIVLDWLSQQEGLKWWWFARDTYEVMKISGTSQCSSSFSTLQWKRLLFYLISSECFWLMSLTWNDTRKWCVMVNNV